LLWRLADPTSSYTPAIVLQGPNRDSGPWALTVLTLFSVFVFISPVLSPIEKIHYFGFVRTKIDIQCRLPETKGGSLRQHRQQRLRDRRLLSDASKVALIAPRRMTAGCTDDADGTDVVFDTCVHPDHSRPCAAFPEKCDLDA
jgi:hypothetical protein